MLGKFMKHEFQETARLMIPLNLVILVYTIIGMIMLGSRLLASPSMTILAMVSLMIYMLSLFAIFIVAYVYFTVRFYKTMYTSQGYLTHTLPLTTGMIINTKVLVSLFWIVITVLMTIASVFALVATAAGQELGEILFSEFIPYTGFSLANFFVSYFFFLIFGCLESLLMAYASLSIGQLFRQYRVLASIGIFILMHIGAQILGTVTLFVTQMFSMDRLLSMAVQTEESFASFYNGILSVSSVECILLCILFYFLCYWLTDKKLNLE